MIWSLEQTLVLKDFLKAVTSEEDVATVNEILNDFEENVVPNYDKFTKGFKIVILFKYNSALVNIVYVNQERKCRTFNEFKQEEDNLNDHF